MNNNINDKKYIIIDIRSSDEVMEIHFDGKKMNNFYNIPANMIRFNREAIIKHLVYVDTIYLVCNSSRRANMIKNKYFKNIKNIKVDLALQFNNLPYSKGEYFILLNDNTKINIWLDGTFSYNLYNMTRVIQIIVGTIMLLCGLTLFRNKYVSIYIKVILIGMGLMALFNGLTNTCILAILFKDIMN
jgi:rhodanese-related sulfurtransferase